MAEVFLARLVGVEGFRKQVVLKRVLPHLSDDPRFLELFLDEARLASQLTHPNICQIFELGQERGRYFLAMEFVDGHNLRDIERALEKRGARMPVEHAVRVACTICEALHHAHTRRDDRGEPLGIVHRDVSPSNVVLSFDGATKLIDFGIARSLTTEGRTRAGAVVGKAGYMSPEQCRGEPVDLRTDIFSAGAVLFQLLTGTLATDGTNEAELLTAGTENRIKDPREGYGIDEKLAVILARALAPSPDDRYADAATMQLDLERFLSARSMFSNANMLGEYMNQLFGEELQLRALPSRRSKDAGTLSGVVTLIAPAPSGERSTITGEEPPGGASSADPLPAPSDATPYTRVRTSPRSRKPAAAGFVAFLSVVGTAVGIWLWPVSPAAPSQPSNVDSAAEVPNRTPKKAPRARAKKPLSSTDAKPQTAARKTSARAKPAATGTQRRAKKNASAPPVPKKPARTRRADGRSAPTAKSPTKSPTRSAPKAEALGKGTLHVNTTPWSEVWLGGKRLGITPLAGVALEAGRHSLVLKNPKLGVTKKVAVRIRPNETTRLTIRLE